MASRVSLMPSVTLYKWPEAWDLPSCSPACIQVEAYLRLARTSFQVEPCSSTSKSPTGNIPGLENDADISGPGDTDFAAAREAIAFAKRTIKDLDAHLNQAQRAELAAFSALIEHRLDVAVEYNIWSEPHGYKEFAKAAFKGQPFPLSYIIPFSLRREACKRLAALDGEQVYTAAAQALSALSDRLRTSGGAWLFGSLPCSLDALLLGHLLFLRASPAAAPVLQQKVSGLPALSEYVDRATSSIFATPAPQRVPMHQVEEGAEGTSGQGSSSWSDAAKGERKPTKPAGLTAAEKQFRRNSWLWLAGAGAVVIGYILFSGRYFALEDLGRMLGQADDGEDDGGDDGDDDDGGDDD